MRDPRESREPRELRELRDSREPYPYPHSAGRRGGYPGEDEGYQGGRPRDPYQGPQEPPLPSYSRDEKPMHRHRNEYPPIKADVEDIDDRGRKRTSYPSSREHKGKTLSAAFLDTHTAKK